jgi:hypothetical protein
MDWTNIPVKRAWKFCQDLQKKHAKDHYISQAEWQVVQGFEGKEDAFVKKVSDFMASPPVMNSTGGQNACRQICVREVADIVKKCKESGTQFTDPDWDMTSNPNSVLYVDQTKPGWDCTAMAPTTYKRLSTIVRKAKEEGAMGALGGLFGGASKKPKKALKPLVFKGAVKPGDIIQGQIGTCFLLGAIGAMACHKEKSFAKIFMKYDVDVGVYGVRFNIDGEWKHVIVDDWMPVDEYGELMYSRCKDPQEVGFLCLRKRFVSFTLAMKCATAERPLKR